MGRRNRSLFPCDWRDHFGCAGLEFILKSSPLKNRGIRASFLACPFVFVNKDIFIVDIIIECDIIGIDSGHPYSYSNFKRRKHVVSMECRKRCTSVVAEVSRW